MIAVKITDVSIQKKNEMRVSVFVDGEYMFSLDAADAALRGIKPGRELSQKEIKNLIMDAEYTKARDYAMSVLSRKAISSKALGDKLSEKGYADMVIPEVIRELEELGYIDDRAYAKMYMEYCTEKLWGSRKIDFEMKNKGIPSDIIDELLSEYSEKDMTEAMSELIIAKYSCDDISNIKTKSKITRYFASRGFDFSKIDAAIKRAAEELANE